MFVKNKKEGDYYGYYKDGSKNFIFQFNKGEYHGTNKLWTKEGLLIEEGNFKEGYEFGVQKTWYLNGKVKSNYIIKNNRRYGLLGTKNCVNVSGDLLKFSFCFFLFLVRKAPSLACPTIIALILPPIF